MCNGARYGVPQPVIIFPLSPFLFLSFLLPTPYFSSVEYASNAFFATWRHACVCCTQIFSMVAYFRHSPRAHLTSTGKKTGGKKGKKKKTRKKTRCIAPVLTHFPSVPISWSRLKCGSAGPRASGAAVLIHRVPVRTILRAKARANMITIR